MRPAAVRLGEFEKRLGLLYKNWRTPEGTFNWFVRDDELLVIGDVDNHITLLAFHIISEEGGKDTDSRDDFRKRFDELKEELKDPFSAHVTRIRWAGMCDENGVVGTRWTSSSLGMSAPGSSERGQIDGFLPDAIQLFAGYALPPDTRGGRGFRPPTS